MGELSFWCCLCRFGLFANEDAGAAAYVTACREIGRALQYTSRHRGVSYNKLSGKWLARITVDGKMRRLGLFADEDAAAAAYVATCHEIGRDPTVSDQRCRWARQLPF